MKLLEPDYKELLRLAHVRWLNERSGEASAAFDRALMMAIRADHERRKPAGRVNE